MFPAAALQLIGLKMSTITIVCVLLIRVKRSACGGEVAPLNQISVQNCFMGLTWCSTEADESHRSYNSMSFCRQASFWRAIQSFL